MVLEDVAHQDKVRVLDVLHDLAHDVNLVLQHLELLLLLVERLRGTRALADLLDRDLVARLNVGPQEDDGESAAGGEEDGDCAGGGKGRRGEGGGGGGGGERPAHPARSRLWALVLHVW